MSAELSIVVKIGAAIGSTIAAIRSVGGGVDFVRRSTTLLRREQLLLGRAIRDSSRQGSSELRRLQRQYDGLGETMSRIRRNQNQRGRIDAAIQRNRSVRDSLKSEILSTVAAVGVVSVPIKLAIEFESAMADVRKVVNFDTPEQAKAMERDILHLTRSIPMAGDELAAIVAAGGQSGVAREKLIGFAEDAAKMGVAFDMSAGTAGEAMATMSNVLRRPIETMSEFGDAINYLSDNTNSKAADIVNVMTRVGSDIKQLGLTDNQGAALGSTFLSMGKAPELAAQATKGMVTAFSLARVGKFDDELKQLGLTTKDFAAAMDKDAQGAISDFLQRVRQLPKEQQMPLLLKMFGRNYADDVLLLTGSMEEYNRQLNLLSETDAGGQLKYMGSMQREFQNRSATTANQLRLFKNSLMELGITVGSVMLPGINDFLKSLMPVVYRMTEWAQANPKLIHTLIKIAVALVSVKAASLGVRLLFNGVAGAGLGVVQRLLGLHGTLLRFNGVFRLLRMGRGATALRIMGFSARQARGAMSLLERGIGRVSVAGSRFLSMAGRVRGLGGAMMWLQRIWTSVGMAAMSNPIGAAIAAIAIAAFLIYKNWGAVKSFFIGLWDGIQDGIRPVLPLLEMIAFGWQQIWDVVKGFFSDFFSSNDEASESAQGFGYIIGYILGSILNIGPMILDGWRMIFDGIFSLVGSAWEQIKTAFDGGLLGILGLILNWSPIGAFYSAFAAVLSWFGIELPGKFTEFGSNIISGLWNGLKAKFEEVKAWFSGVAGWFSSKFAIRNEIHSPSRLFRRFGGWMMQGLQMGIDGGASRPLNAIGSVASDLQQRFSDNTSSLAASMAANSAELSAARQGTAAAGGITVHFSPTINAPGGDAGQIQAALQMGLREFEQLFERLMADKARRAY
ncbi:phage tail tape measure protein [Eikenella halliae]|uniref:Phage tail tape measure protein n=1 Tax=Eikenella halliae TaxID=1795832 RepID=A0A1B6VVF5_9NEIS|nr:phage tail tape measure protein [Eikenella halliae]OAM37489.1 phage tail tape measure protein [Eikenella halliae]